VGGVLGKGLTVTIADNTSYAVVTGNGPGYNTSAGGIAGYIQQSTVIKSAAFGEVTLGAAWESGSYDYWQVYAGGLVGYSGGTASGGSSITQSRACGAVSANSPYPYAGGLVGYNYGYAVYTQDEWLLYYRGLLKDNATVTSNGSRITESYATGNVQATATANGLPYAGGLVGYSSIPTATKNPAPNIENCYAKGNVIATSGGMYAWAGGLIGANAQGSIVSKTYAIGTVDVKVGENKLPYDQPGINPGAAGGGIAGVNYYVDETSTLPPLVTLSVGLNTLIYGTSASPSVAPYLLHRVAGDLGQNNTGTLNDNYGNDSMSILPVWNKDIGLDGLDGASVAAQPDQSFYTSAPMNWDFSNIWKMGADGYPDLIDPALR
jgi:hypothetical protein